MSQLPSDTLLLVRGAVDDDAAARDELFRRYLPRVRRIAALRMGSRLRELAEVEDVVQSALLSAWKSLDQFEARSDGDFTSWMARIVENTLRGLARHHRAACREAARRVAFTKTDDTLSSLVLRGEGTTPSEAAAGREFEERLEEALLALSEADREAIILSRLCDMSGEELARQLGLATSSTARARVARALARLSSMLEPRS